MKCPVDDETLLMTQRDGVEIDYCPKCRGVWLDRGELDKIIDRASPLPAAPSAPVAAHPSPSPSGAAPVYQAEPHRADLREPREALREDKRGKRYHDDDDDDDDDRRYGKRKRRESFLSELFDF